MFIREVVKLKNKYFIILIILVCTAVVIGFYIGHENSGTAWLVATDAPTSATHGENGDFYLDTINYDIYQKIGDKWVKIGNIAGKDGATPEIEINEDGDWVVNGKVTSVKAEGQDGDDGKTPTITIDSSGYWVINGKKTGILAIGTPGQDGKTPSIKIDEEGYWIINGEKTDVQAVGVPGHDGKDGQDGKDGVDGKNVEFIADGTVLKWRYVGDTDWNELFDLSKYTLYDDRNPVILSVDANPFNLWCINSKVTCTMGTNIVVQVSNNEAYNFVVLNDDGEYLELLMNRNLGLTFEWTDDDHPGKPYILLNTLIERTSSWVNIEPIVEFNYTNDNFVFDVNNGMAFLDGETLNTSDNLLRARVFTVEEARGYKCSSTADSCPEIFGLNLQPENNSLTPYGYWTMSPHVTLSNPANAYSIHYNSNLNSTGQVSHVKGRGLRPIIKIKKYKE